MDAIYCFLKRAAGVCMDVVLNGDSSMVVGKGILILLPMEMCGALKFRPVAGFN